MFAFLALGIFIAVETGWAGFGFAQLRSNVFPRDESLLAYVPGSSAFVVVVDPHQIDPATLGSSESVVRKTLDRMRTDVKNTSDVDLLFDVDKVAFGGAATVARGRFSMKKLESKLGEAGYKRQDYKGHGVLVHPNVDAVAVDDDVLLYGSEENIHAALDAHDGSTGLNRDEGFCDRLSAVGWNHAVVGLYRVGGDKPSLREAITGSTGARSYGLSLATKPGLAANVLVEAASPGAAEELRKILEAKKGDAAALAAALPADFAQGLTDTAKRATVGVKPGTSYVEVHAVLDPATLDKLVAAAEKSTPAGLFDNIRLLQLLAPSGS